MTTTAEGDWVAVEVPASSANLGPGFDVAGLALGITDRYRARPIPGAGVRVASVGEGAADVPTDARHLVAASLLTGLRHAGIEPPGLVIECRNAIPHGRGLGSSSAAIVGGLWLARSLLGRLDPGSPALSSREDVLQLAAQIEGHPDNVAAALLGGFTLAWAEADRIRAVSLPVHAAVRACVYVPDRTTPTQRARAALPAAVPLADAVLNLGRAALLVHAMTAAPDLLVIATEDRLHQPYRRDLYHDSLTLVESLRAGGVAAFISGAGPTVAALWSSGDGPGDAAGFVRLAVDVGGGVRQVESW